MISKLKSLQAKLLWLLFSFAPFGASAASSVNVDYALTPLGTPGLYQYRYTVTNVSLASPLSLFSVDFNSALYDESSLQITTVGLGDWSEQTLVSIPILGVPAQYDAYKMTGTPLGIGDSEVGFTVQFTWLGAGAPGAQAFAVYDPNNLNVLDAGFTTALVPEPTRAALALFGLSALLVVRHRAASRAPSVNRTAHTA